MDIIPRGVETAAEEAVLVVAADLGDPSDVQDDQRSLVRNKRERMRWQLLSDAMWRGSRGSHSRYLGAALGVGGLSPLSWRCDGLAAGDRAAPWPAPYLHRSI